MVFESFGALALHFHGMAIHVKCWTLGVLYSECIGVLCWGNVLECKPCLDGWLKNAFLSMWAYCHRGQFEAL